MKNIKYKILPYNNKYKIVREIYLEENNLFKVVTILKNVNKKVAKKYINTL